MNFFIEEKQRQVEQLAGQFAAKEIFPLRKDLEKDPDLQKKIFPRMAQAGLLTLCVPKNQGGHQVDNIAYVLAMRAIARADAGLAAGMCVTNLVSEALTRFGTAEQRREYIPDISGGRLFSCSFAVTEREAGSDAAALKTTAIPDPHDANYYILNGEKYFITSADIAGLIVVLAKTEAESSPSALSGTTPASVLKASKPEFSAFLVDPRQPGFILGPRLEKMGQIASSTVSFQLVDCRVHKDKILGKKGKGLMMALGILDAGRIGIAALSLGIADAAYAVALDYANRRQQFGRSIIQFEVIQFKLADMLVKLRAAELQTFQAAWLKDNQQSFVLEASMAKLSASEACMQIVDEALQIHGGYGYSKDTLIEKYYRDARITRIYEGSSEIQRLVIAREIMRGMERKN